MVRCRSKRSTRSLLIDFELFGNPELENQKMMFSVSLLLPIFAALAKDTGFPGDPMLHPAIHFTPIVVSLEGG